MNMHAYTGMRRGKESKQALIKPRFSISASSSRPVLDEKDAAVTNGSEMCGPENIFLYSRMLAILAPYN
jgi:hypothetical protein